MAGENGSIPDGGIPMTLALLRQYSRKAVRLPGLSARAGQAVYVIIRPVRHIDWALMQPPPPAEADAWPEDPVARAPLARAWYESLSEVERAERRRLISDMSPRLAALAVVDLPGEDWIRDLGDDLEILAAEIKVWSGLQADSLSAQTDAQAPAAG